MKKITTILLALIIMVMSLTAFSAGNLHNEASETLYFKTEVVYGDLTGNGKVEMDDVVCALRGALGITDLSSAQYAAIDVDGVEGVSISDVVFILKYELRIIDTFPIENIQRPSEPAISSEPADSNILVAYFSATNRTEKLAEYIADEFDADIYEIVPAVPYTNTDLDYGNSSSRTSMENNDPNARPDISGPAVDMEQYDIIFLGYPIWFGKAPKIISTFLESYNFSGKTIVPFCTSGSSPIGSSAANLHNLAGSADWLEGMRFSASSSRSEVVEWVRGLNLNLNVIPSEPVNKYTPAPSSTASISDKEESKYMLNIKIGEHLLTATLVQNSSTEALIEMLSAGDIKIDMHDYAEMEKVGSLPESLPRNDEQISTQAGDLILYQGNSFVIYYDTNSWNFTRLGKIDNVTQQELKDILGEGNVTAVLSFASK